MKTLVGQEMLSRLSRMFGDPRTNDPDGYMDEFERALRGFSRDVLVRATNDLVDNATKPFWPTVGEAKSACIRATSTLSALARHQAGTPKEPEMPPPTPEEAARIWALVNDARQKMASLQEPERDVPDVSRVAFENFRNSVISTADGRARHRANSFKRGN